MHCILHMAATVCPVFYRMSRIESFSSLDGILVNYKLPFPVFHPLSPTVVDAKTRVFGPGVQHTKDDTTTSTLWLQEIL